MTESDKTEPTPTPYTETRKGYELMLNSPYPFWVLIPPNEKPIMGTGDPFSDGRNVDKLMSFEDGDIGTWMRGVFAKHM